MTYEEFTEQLSTRPKAFADTARLQARYGQPLLGTRYSGRPPEMASAALLVVCWPGDDGTALLALVKHRRAPLFSPRRIGFPGGRRKITEHPTDTALREAHEELGVKRNRVEGMVPLPMVTTTYPLTDRIAPFVGLCPTRPDFRPDGKEVSQLVPLPLGAVLSPSTFKVRTFGVLGNFAARYFAPPGLGRGERIFGLAAMVLGPLVELVRSRGSSDRRQQEDRS